MNFKDEMKQKVAQIEIILDEYLPAQEGLQKNSFNCNEHNR